MRDADWLRVSHALSTVSALTKDQISESKQHIPADQMKRYPLSIADQTERRCIQQLRLDPTQHHCHIRTDARHLRRIRGIQPELARSPSGDEIIKVVEIKDGRVIGEGGIELDGHLVRLEVADVEDPDLGGLTIDCEGELFVDLR